MAEDVYPRSQYEALMDVDFAICLSQRHERLYGRIKKGVSLLTLLAGSSVIGSLIAQRTDLVIASALITAVAAGVDRNYDFGALAAAHRNDAQRFLKVRARAENMTWQRIDTEMARARQGCAQVIEGLKQPVHLANLRRHGRSGGRPLTAWERLMDTIA